MEILFGAIGAVAGILLGVLVGFVVRKAIAEKKIFCDREMKQKRN